MKRCDIRLGGLCIRLLSERELTVDESLRPFCAPPRGAADVTVRFSWDWRESRLPTTPPLGEDLLCRYYREGAIRSCLTRAGPKGPIACARYTDACDEIDCWINEEPFLLPQRELVGLLRMIPLRAVFRRAGVLFFHAAQIAYQGRGILFTAPSGTGKTTQAMLWRDHRGAALLCGDRTLVRCVDGAWRTYGYPLDGSEPVRTTESRPLGALVLLAQGAEDRVERLTPARGARDLMEQLVIDGWDPAARAAALDRLLTLMERIPVYRQTCTPGVRAVETLERTLEKDGVIGHGEDL